MSVVAVMPGAIVLTREFADSSLPNVIPRQDFHMAGRDLSFVPHTETAVRLLSNLGVQGLPAPIEVPGQYQVRGRFAPYKHQWKQAGFVTLHDRCFVLSEMATGKTSSVLWAADYLMQKGAIRSALIVAPLSCLRRVWEDEIFTSVPGRTCAVVHGGREKREAALASGADFYITNHDGVKLIADALESRPDIGLVICDEFTAFKSHSSDRSKAMFRIAKTRRLWMMSATPMAQGPEDAYFPCKLVNPDRAGTLGRWRDATMVQLSKFKWAPRNTATEFVKHMMQPAILFRRDEVLDLPPQVYIKREAPLTKEQEQARMHLKVLRRAQMEETGGTVTATNAAVLAGKLLQVAQGAVIQDLGAGVKTLDCAPRLAVLDEVIDEAQAKIIVFAPYTATVNMVYEHLSTRFNVAKVDGSVSAGARNDVFSRFQNGGVEIIVAHPKTMSHGLTLTAADMIVWFGPTTSTETFIQANLRINRPGQTRSTTVVMIASTPEEWQVYRALEGRADLQDVLLDMYKNFG